MAIEAVSDIKRAGASAFSGGGSASLSHVAVSVPQAVYDQAAVTVANAAATSGSVVMCQLGPNADWDADDLAEFSVIGAADNGSIIFTVMRPGPIVGNFLIIYMLG